MKILFIGGNGNISWNCVQRALEANHDVTILNRAMSRRTRRMVQPQVKQILADVHNREELREKIKGYTYDVVCDFICYNDEHARIDIDVFSAITKQFIFISSDAVYKRIEGKTVYCEEDELCEPEVSSSYIAGKILAEKEFMKAFKEQGFPITIVRPGYTYDTILPISIGHNCYTAIQFIKEGHPLIMAADGECKRNFTHAMDFANAFVWLLGNRQTIGQIYNLASDQIYTWKDAAETLLKLLHIEKNRILNITYEEALHLEKFAPKDMMIQRMSDVVLNISKIKKISNGWKAEIDLEKGMQMTLQWLEEDEKRRRFVEYYANIFDEIYQRHNM